MSFSNSNYYFSLFLNFLIKINITTKNKNTYSSFSILKNINLFLILLSITNISHNSLTLIYYISHITKQLSSLSTLSNNSKISFLNNSKTTKLSFSPQKSIISYTTFYNFLFSSLKKNSHNLSLLSSKNPKPKIFT